MLILNKENDVLQVNSINEHNIKNIDLLTKQVNSFFEYLNREDIIKMLNSEKYDNIFYLYLYYNIKEKLFLLSKELKDKEKKTCLDLYLLMILNIIETYCYQVTKLH